jgi:hypothetical protein
MGNCCPCLKPDTHAYQEIPQSSGKKMSFDRHINTMETENTVMSPAPAFELPPRSNEDEVCVILLSILNSEL